MLRQPTTLSLPRRRRQNNARAPLYVRSVRWSIDIGYIERNHLLRYMSYRRRWECLGEIICGAFAIRRLRKCTLSAAAIGGAGLSHTPQKEKLATDIGGACAICVPRRSCGRIRLMHATKNCVITRFVLAAVDACQLCGTIITKDRWTTVIGNSFAVHVIGNLTGSGPRPYPRGISATRIKSVALTGQRCGELDSGGRHPTPQCERP
jgi:hypothetical protein